MTKMFTKGFYLVILTFVVSSSAQSFKCPDLLNKIPEKCSKLKCEREVNKELCPKDTIYIHNFSLCKCCPQCVRFLSPEDKDTPCVPAEKESEVLWTPDPDCQDESHCPVNVNVCLPGFVCNEAEKLCEFPPAEPPPDHENEECMFRKSLKVLELHHWDPNCEADGSFSPKQCKGTHYDGECFCVNRAGTRIFGREWRIQAENQTCECSRKVSELRARGFISTLHCSPDGNYEPLQCDMDSGLCYCVDPKTGKMDGSAIPQYHWKSLPCYSVNLTNWEEDGKYLRKCESAYAGIRDLQIFGKEHGTSRIEMKVFDCDYDGSYAPKQIDSTNTQCVFKNGTRIKDYFKPSDSSMTCNCARDHQEYFPFHDRPLDLDCQMRTGNYDVAYDFGSHASCMDSDGFLYGDIVPSKYFCCLLKEGCAPLIEQSCYWFKNETGFRHCAHWHYRN